MKLTLVGSRYFGTAALERLLKESVEIARVIVPAADDRLALAASAAGLQVVVLDDPAIVPADSIRRYYRAIVESPRWNGRSRKAIRSPAARSTILRKRWTRERSLRRIGALSAREKPHASFGSARSRRWVWIFWRAWSAKRRSAANCQPRRKTSNSQRGRRWFAPSSMMIVRRDHPPHRLRNLSFS